LVVLVMVTNPILMLIQGYKIASTPLKLPILP
jgi:hypothetical protein